MAVLSYAVTLRHQFMLKSFTSQKYSVKRKANTHDNKASMCVIRFVMRLLQLRNKFYWLLLIA